MNMSDDLMAEIDQRANELHVSRTAYITMALAQKMEAERISRSVPELAEAIKNAEEALKYAEGGSRV